MLRQSPSRNQRSKGIKVKHVLQICVLLAICIWLLYQIKHSHDKKAALDASTEKISEKVQNDHEILKFGRKDLHPRLVETANENEIHEGEGTEEEEEEEEEENNQEEEEESKAEESEDDGRGGGDDEIDERDQEKAEEEAELGEEFVDEEERDREEKESEEKQVQIKDSGSSEDQVHDTSNRITQEAREEQYKGDDASSAVFRDTQIISTETEDGALSNSNEEERVENTKKNGLEEENKISSTEEKYVDQNDSGLKGESEIAGNSTSVIATASERKGDEITLPELEDGSHLKSTLTTGPNDKPENNNPTAVNAGIPGSSLQNGTDILLDSTRDQNVTVETPTSKGYDSNLQIVVMEQTENSDTTNGGAQLDSNLTLSTAIKNAGEGHGELTDSSSNSKPDLPHVQTMKSDVTVGAEESSASSTTNENAGVIQSEKSNANTGTEESFASSIIIENSNAVLSDPIDSSDSWNPQEEK
ncbi:hypothetical protein HHK36_031077 [Tetracentron sinense]|uniref:Uncharacterized protein n=1 Tax=Tetracentron sinense TaxID=13715 RepID=A0A834Y8S1_TETSI|nr:hypothetical protein HHK36_031077 [Tetracentron sinense]